MLELFHSLHDSLDPILEEGIKSPYQLALEGKGRRILSLDEMTSLATPATTRLLVRCTFFFFGRDRFADNWVSVLVDEEDDDIMVGNVNLVETAYGDGYFYEDSMMPLATYMERCEQRLGQADAPVNPFTSEIVTDREMEELRLRYTKGMGAQLTFEYKPEFIIPRLVIPPSEFCRKSIDALNLPR